MTTPDEVVLDNFLSKSTFAYDIGHSLPGRNVAPTVAVKQTLFTTSKLSRVPTENSVHVEAEVQRSSAFQMSLKHPGAGVNLGIFPIAVVNVEDIAALSYVRYDAKAFCRPRGIRSCAFVECCAA
jgi:hypothetical protein